MFTFAGLPEPYSLLSQFALITIIALLIVGAALNRYAPERLGRMPKLLELPQSLLLVVFSVFMLILTSQERGAQPAVSPASVAMFTFFGIAFGFLGDLFMADVFRQRNHVTFGMLAFAVGHVFYLLAFREYAVFFVLHDLFSYVVAFVLMWTAAGILWLLLVRSPDGGTIQYIALGYALFLASMAAFALGLAFQNTDFWPLALGAVLFLLSDTLIAARLFAGRVFPFMGDVIWVTYIAAQVFIVTQVPRALFPA